MDLSQTLPVIYFGVITSLVVFLVHVVTAVYGFRKPEPTSMDSLSADES
jgi:hypothetical protein